ncbi:MAG: transposase [Proteobacteria bacterium]|nr:transposase [Pseudomonadota bacterium]
MAESEIQTERSNVDALDLRLCRYITRPALAYERVQCDAAGRVVLKLKTPWRDGTTHLVMSSAGVHAAARGLGSQTKAAPDSLPRRACTQRQAASTGRSARTAGRCRRPGGFRGGRAGAR